MTPRVIQVYALGRMTKDCDECGAPIVLYKLAHARPGSSGRMPFNAGATILHTLAGAEGHGNIYELDASDAHWTTCTKPGKFRQRDQAAERNRRGLPPPPKEVRPCLRCGLKVTGKLRRAGFTGASEFIADNHRCIPKEHP
jgi:hypothetical protein